MAEDILAMVTTLPYDLRGLRDRAILLLGFAGCLRRSEIVGRDVHKDDTLDSGGWIEIFDKGVLLTLNAKTGWREVEIGRGTKEPSCPLTFAGAMAALCKDRFRPSLRRHLAE